MAIDGARKRWMPLMALLVVIATAAALAVGFGRVTSAGAQDERKAAGGDESHPAHIHTGTCDQLGDVVLPLSNVSLAGLMDGTPMAGAAMGPASAVPVKSSVTTVAAALTDIVDGGHAVNVHESMENIGTYIACGDIGGAMMGEQLVIGLQELNDSGHAGVAILEAMGEATLVTVYLVEDATGGTGDTTEGDAGTPAVGDAGTPAAGGDGSGGAAAVSIVDFDFEPAEITVPVGGTITWTNTGEQPHTATAQDRELLQSGTLRPDDTYNETFDTAGTYEYFCEFHANMKGTIVVE